MTDNSPERVHKKNTVTGGKSIDEAKKALIMVHGRGASASDILGLASHLLVKDYALVAPQATNFTWYPYSFLVPPGQNEPWLSSAIRLLQDVVYDITEKGIAAGNIYFAGFSQGASLSLEFVARHARKWGGVAAFTGGLIGDRVYRENYSGDFEGTPVFIGTSEPDIHVPVERVRETADVLRSMNARVALKIYPGMGHTINEDEIRNANDFVFS